mgnify:CR=1 FL=1
MYIDGSFENSIDHYERLVGWLFDNTGILLPGNYTMLKLNHHNIPQDSPFVSQILGTELVRIHRPIINESSLNRIKEGKRNWTRFVEV